MAAHTPLTLMALWSRHKVNCRPVGGIVRDAREGRLPGVRQASEGNTLEVIDQRAALAAMQKETH